jgi:hypothetical protein
MVNPRKSWSIGDDAGYLIQMTNGLQNERPTLLRSAAHYG